MRTIWIWALLISGCAHAEWRAAEHRLCAGETCYQVGALAAGWHVVHQEGGEVGFFNDSAGAIIQSNASCRDDADAAPLSTLTNHLLIGYTDRRVRSQERVELDRREALRTVLDVRLDGVPMVLDLYVLIRNGCIFDLSLAAPPSAYATALGDFQRFVSGFQQGGRS